MLKSYVFGYIKPIGISGATILSNAELSVPFLNITISILTITYLIIKIRNERKS